MARLNRVLAAELQKVGNRFAKGILDGFKQDYPELYRELNKLMDELARSMSRSVTMTVSVVYQDAGTGGATGATGGTATATASTRMAPLMFGTPPPVGVAAAPRSSAAGVNITVNAGMGADGAEIGRQIVDSLRQYERRNGPIPVSVTG